MKCTAKEEEISKRRGTVKKSQQSERIPLMCGCMGLELIGHSRYNLFIFPFL